MSFQFSVEWNEVPINYKSNYVCNRNPMPNAQCISDSYGVWWIGLWYLVFERYFDARFFFLVLFLLFSFHRAFWRVCWNQLLTVNYVCRMLMIKIFQLVFGFFLFVLADCCELLRGDDFFSAHDKSRPWVHNLAHIHTARDAIASILKLKSNEINVFVKNKN